MICQSSRARTLFVQLMSATERKQGDVKNELELGDTLQIV